MIFMFIQLWMRSHVVQTLLLAVVLYSITQYKAVDVLIFIIASHASNVYIISDKYWLHKTRQNEQGNLTLILDNWKKQGN